MERPPHRLPRLLDVLRLAPSEEWSEVAHEERVHGAAAGAHGIRVAHPLRTLGVAHPHGYQLEGADGAVRAIRQRDGQRDAVVIGLNLVNQHRRAS